MTDVVVAVLRDAGYSPTPEPWDCHNVVIFSILDASGAELIPTDIEFGYDDRRDYLPDAIITLLDADPRTSDAGTEVRS